MVDRTRRTVVLAVTVVVVLVVGVVRGGAGGDMLSVVGLPPPESRRCPFALGVVVLTPDALVEDRQTARLAVAVAAYEQGYHLLDLVEVPGRLDGAVVGRLWALAAGVEAQALFVRALADGGDTAAVLEPMAAELRMTLRPVDHPSLTASGDGSSGSGGAVQGLAEAMAARAVLGRR